MHPPQPVRRESASVSWPRHAALAAAIVLALLPPLLFSDYIVFRFTSALVWSIAILGLVILCGTSGQFSFAHAAFFGIGGYVAAMMANHTGLSPYAALPVAVLVSFAVGWAVGLVAGGQGLWNQALITYALAIAFPQLLRWRLLEPVTGGAGGLYLPVLEAPAVSGLTADRWWYLLTLLLLAIGMLLARNLLAGRPGRGLQAVRDHELAAAAQGIDVRRYRAAACGIAAAYAGLAGCLSALQLNYVGPGTYSFWLSVQFLVGLVIGGMGSIAGVLLGGLFLQFFPDAVAAVGRTLSLLLYGVLLIAAIVLMPNGVTGALRRLWLIGSARRARP
jgi:branched-chain amino acid transport system permease protein